MIRTYDRRNSVLVQRAPASWTSRLARAIGEMSFLRQVGVTNTFGLYGDGYYTLDSSKVNYRLARSLYRNTEDAYKLGAAFARPIINTTAGFMGVPSFEHEDTEVREAMEQQFTGWTGRMLRINRNSLRDGDCFVRITYNPNRFDPENFEFQLVLVPPEWVRPVVDPVNGGFSSVVISRPMEIMDETGRVVEKFSYVETLTPTARKVRLDGQSSAESRQLYELDEDNPWGFVPVVHFKNEAEENQLFGASDLEPVEPFMKAYHDVILFATQGSKLFSRPKIKFKLNDVSKFLKDNFSDAETATGGALSFAHKEIFLMEQEDDAEMITAASGVSESTQLLELLFFNIVDASETPEFAFGTAVQSSKASVSEQMTPLSKKIGRKRGQFEEPYGELGTMYLAMWSRVNNRRVSDLKVRPKWGEINPRDDTETAVMIKNLVEGLMNAVKTGIISHQAAADFLREFVPTMLPFINELEDDDESRRIERELKQAQDDALAQAEAEQQIKTDQQVELEKEKGKIQAAQQKQSQEAAAAQSKASASAAAAAAASANASNPPGTSTGNGAVNGANGTVPAGR